MVAGDELGRGRENGAMAGKGSMDGEEGGRMEEGEAEERSDDITKEGSDEAVSEVSMDVATSPRFVVVNLMALKKLY